MVKAQYRTVGDTAIGSILFKGMLVEFLIDTTDLERIKPYRWHLTSNSYIATTLKSEHQDLSGSTPALPKKREVYLHTLLLSPGPGFSVIHISKNGLDNRRKNLRIVPNTQILPQTATKKRTIELPPMCGLTPDDIPKHIWYVQANGYHRDRFAIEFKSEGILWKSSSSKQFSLQEKLQQAKEHLQSLYEKYPHLDPKREEDLIESLQESFQSVLQG